MSMPIKLWKKFKDLKLRYVARHHNTVLPHSTEETYEHWIVKCVLFKVLRSKGREVFTEFKTGNGITDVFDLNESIAYEVETNPSKDIELEKQKLVVPGLVVRVVDINTIPFWQNINEVKTYFEDLV